MEIIFKRRSIRKYIEKDISLEDLTRLVKAGMQAPSAHNQQPWQFIIVNDKETLAKLSKVCEYSNMLNYANAAIISCIDYNKVKESDYIQQDLAAATQNILLEATYLGIGSVWIGIYPGHERIQYIVDLFNLPDNIKPFNIISLGYTDKEFKVLDRFNEEDIHLNKW